MKIQLTVRSRMYADGDVQQSVTHANGFLRVFDGYTELSYREAGGDEGLGNTLTALRLFPARMELIRRGDYTCVLTMEVGVTHECPYMTPFGELLLTTDTASYRASIGDDGHGTVDVQYTLNGDARYELTVTVSPSP